MSALSSATRMRARFDRRCPAAARRGGRQRSSDPARASSTYGLAARRGGGAASAARTRSGPGAHGRAGSVTVNVVPLPVDAARRRRSPPCSSTSSCTSARPMPDPSMRARRRALDAVEALEHVRQLGARDAGCRCRAPAARLRHPALAQRARRIVAAASVNLKAFDSRLRTIFSHISRSTKTGAGERRTVDVEAQAGLFDERRAEGAGQVAGERRQSRSASNWRCRPSGLDAREVEQRVDQLQQPQLRCGATSSSVGAARGVCGDRARASSSGPSISVSGVRNSWLTLLKNAVLARSSSASASARRRSSS